MRREALHPTPSPLEKWVMGHHLQGQRPAGSLAAWVAQLCSDRASKPLEELGSRAESEVDGSRVCARMFSNRRLKATHTTQAQGPACCALPGPQKTVANTTMKTPTRRREQRAQLQPLFWAGPEVLPKI